MRVQVLRYQYALDATITQRHEEAAKKEVAAAATRVQGLQRRRSAQSELAARRVERRREWVERRESDARLDAAERLQAWWRVVLFNKVPAVRPRNG